MEPRTNSIGIQVCFPEPEETWKTVENEEKRWRIVIAKKYFQLSRSKIAGLFFCDPSYVTKVWNNYQHKDGVVEDMRKFNEGRPRKLMKKEEHELEKLIEKNRSVTIPTMAEALSVCEKTISSKLTELKYRKVKPCEKPKLSESAKQKRIEYCLLHKFDKFSNVIFADEAIVQMQENRLLLWHSNDEDRPEMEMIHNNKKLMVWAGISRKGRTDIKIFRIDKGETCDAKTYAETLKLYCIQKGNKLFGKGK